VFCTYANSDQSRVIFFNAQKEGRDISRADWLAAERNIQGESQHHPELTYDPVTNLGDHAYSSTNPAESGSPARAAITWEEGGWVFEVAATDAPEPPPSGAVFALAARLEGIIQALSG
jgi:hypothetical protein